MTWRMKDGSYWRVDNKPPPFQAKRVQNPKVKIYAAALSGYWLEFVDLDYKLAERAKASALAAFREGAI